MTYMQDYWDDIISFEKKIAKLKKELKQVQEARKQLQEEIEQEESLKQLQEKRKQSFIKQLELLDDSSIAHINCMSIDEVAKLRVELLGE